MEKTIWKLELAYDGTDFHGWQVQLNRRAVPTIQGVLEEAIAAVTGERVLPQGSGRTDAGVHALGQVASFSLAAPIPPANLHRALNRALPQAIRVLAARHASADFHARYSSVGKVYRYQIFNGPVCSPFLARYVTCSHWPLDLNAMQQAAQAILGEHDFTSFAATDPDRTARQQARREVCDELNSGAASNVRRIDQSDWSCSSLAVSSMARLRETGSALDLDESHQTDTNTQIFSYTVRGNGFLHHMVRNLVGTFVEIGRGRLAPDAMLSILSGRERSLAGPTAAANGLCLMKVHY